MSVVWYGRVVPLGWLTVLALLLSPLAAAHWSRLIGVEQVFAPLRARLRKGGRFASWLLGGFECATCSATQFAVFVPLGIGAGFGIYTVFDVRAGLWVAAGLETVVVGLGLASLAVVARHAMDATGGAWQWKSGHTKTYDSAELTQGPRFTIVHVRTTNGNTDIAVAPVSATDTLAMPANIGEIFVVPTESANLPPDGWDRYTPPTLAELFGDQ